MDRIRSVVIVGLGALGTLYADAFQQAGAFDVYVLADNERAESYRKSPRILNGRPVSFNYVPPEESGIKADLIMICVKSGGMLQAIKMIENYVGEETVIISLMNGVSCEEELIKRYGAGHVIYSVFKGDGVQNVGGAIRDLGNNRIYFGEAGNPCDEEQVRLLKDFCERAGVGFSVEPDMLYTFWHKFAIIIGLNQVCALLGSTYSVFHSSPEALDLVRKLVGECIPLAAAAGVREPQRLTDDVVALGLSLSPDCYPSIAQDREMKRRMEVDIFAQEVIRRSKALGLEAPYNDMVYALLSCINRQNGYDR